MEPWMVVVVAALGTWRLTHLLHAEDGPWEVIRRLRERIPAGQLTDLVSCFLCLSMWVAIPFAALIAHDLKELVLLWPALSGAAILLERATGTPAVIYQEDPP